MSVYIENIFDLPHLLDIPKSGMESCLLEAEALRSGLDILRLDASVFIAKDPYGSATVAFRRSWSIGTSVVASECCTNKAFTKALLTNAGVPTAISKKMPRKGYRSAEAFAAEVGWPVVVKPLKGSGGKGVTANIQSSAELREAVAIADSLNGFLMEKHVPGEDYRFLVVGQQVAGIWRRNAANVVGNGVSTVRDLIERKNLLRATNPHLCTRPIVMCSITDMHLSKVGLNLASVPAAGQIVYLRSAANLSAGGDNVDVTDETHESLKSIAIHAVAAIPGIQHAGVDILLEDHTQSADSQEVNVCEVNGQPGLSAHDFPVIGKPRHVVKDVFQFFSEQAGIELSNELAVITVSVQVIGRFKGGRLAERVRQHAIRHGLEISLNDDEERIWGTMKGAPELIAVVDNFAARPEKGEGMVEYVRVQLVR